MGHFMCLHRSEYVKGVTSRRITFIKCVESVDVIVMSLVLKIGKFDIFNT